ncbi:kinase 1B [Medicago truncatula]|nr:kinase 1B [Medicago truncatula]
MIGKGGFGCVFKGWIDEHTLAPTKQGTGFAVSVKRLNDKSNQGHSEWLTEINYLGQLHHPNLVKLIGYCIEDECWILVYEFLTKGSLDNLLFKRASNFQPLTWKIRMKIALDVAKGLAFLHSDEVNVIHGNLKTSKILIDSNHNAKLYNFGLAKDIPEIDMIDPDMVYIQGPYDAPEYKLIGHLTKKSDVYGFGVVLLEIMSGKRALDYNRPRWENDLVVWARPLLINKEKIYQVMDSCIEGQYSPHEAMEVARIAIQCLSCNSKNRPNIDDVVRSLEKL